MSKLLIRGKRRLSGETEVQGAKNSVLPLLAASILAKGESVFLGCPHLSDVEASTKILRYLGCKVSHKGDTICVNADGVNRYDIPNELMREMRSSIVFLGAIISHGGKARLSFPGGCELGPRPIDLHLKALRQMGVSIEEKYGVLECSCENGINGGRIALSFPSVGATENIMIAAVLAKGTTTITNAAREPEICDLAEYLNRCGARIYGAGEGTIVIDGVKSLTGCCHTVIPDRIVAATLMSAAAVTSGDVLLHGVMQSHLGAVIPVFEEAGCKVTFSKGDMRITAPKVLNSVKHIRTMPYPGFPTDCQAPIMAMTAVSKGTSVIVENIFENRFRHVGELERMGANIKVEGKVAVVEGVSQLFGTTVVAPDLRGAASLVTAGLCAQGTTQMSGVNFLERGYESLETVLSGLGAEIKKI